MVIIAVAVEQKQTWNKAKRNYIELSVAMTDHQRVKRTGRSDKVVRNLRSRVENLSSTRRFITRDL